MVGIKTVTGRFPEDRFRELKEKKESAPGDPNWEDVIEAGVESLSGGGKS